jgi:glycosyltransferase involved in cell wall biosynthesis
LQQSHKPIQIIVADDASTDNTIALLHTTYGNQITVLQTAHNTGSAATRNRGIAIATGTHIAFLDADDEWHPEKLAYITQALVAIPNAQLVFHNYRLYSRPQPYFPASVLPKPLSFFRLLRGNCIVTSCAVIRTDLGYRFNEQMRHTEDYDLWLRITYSGLVCSLPHTLTVLHRPVTSPGGISSNIWAMRKGELMAYTHLVQYNVLWVLLLPLLWIYSLIKHVARALGVMKRGVSYTKMNSSK